MLITCDSQWADDVDNCDCDRQWADDVYNCDCDRQWALCITMKRNTSFFV